MIIRTIKVVFTLIVLFTITGCWYFDELIRRILVDIKDYEPKSFNLIRFNARKCLNYLKNILRLYARLKKTANIHIITHQNIKSVCLILIFVHKKHSQNLCSFNNLLFS